MTCIIFFFEKKQFLVLVLLHLNTILNDIFHWQVYCFMLIKSSLRFDDAIVGLVIVKKSEVSSANSFALQCNLYGKSLM